MSLVSLEKVTKKYKKRKVIDELSLNISSGEIFGLIGKSGCGKTTLLKLLIGMISADAGKIYFNDKSVFFNKRIIQKNTGFATQENMLYEELTLKENIKYYGKLYGVSSKDIKERTDCLSQLLGLSDFKKEYIKNLSGGMKKRANILVSLVHNPALLILDEPTVGLDSILRDTIWYYIKEINNLGKTIIVTSHLLEELEKNCSRIGIMGNGKVLKVINAKEKNVFAKKTLNEIFKETVENG